MEKKVKVTKDGPYIVCGEFPLLRELIVCDDEGTPEKWEKGEKIKTDKEYELCRCGGSSKKPFCDGTHHRIKFKGEETADNKKFSEKAEIINGPELVLKDASEFCVGAGFCHGLSGVWDLTKRSDDSKCKKAAINEACNCPSGRLVAYDKKTGKAIEPNFKQSVSLIGKKNSNLSGPIWVKGRIPIESSEGKKYEVRNRVTLCRCGRSNNKPLCDGTHIEIKFSDKKK